LKKLICSVICIVALVLFSIAGNATAYMTGYSHTCYAVQNAVTIDGKWTASTEWTDGLATSFGTTASFRDKWQMDSGASTTTVYEYILIETTDNTNDASDYYQICFDGSADGGTAPQTDDFRVDITGHGSTATMTWYKGTGSGWSTITAPSTAVFQYAEALDTSPTTSTSHYMLEIKMEKTSTTLGGSQIVSATFCMRVAVNDASAGASALQSWPPGNRDVPNDYGNIPYDSNALPESLSVGLVLALSAVAVIGGAVLLRKKPLAHLPKQVAV
jgi:hypothetical protein